MTKIDDRRLVRSGDSRDRVLNECRYKTEDWRPAEICDCDCDSEYLLKFFYWQMRATTTTTRLSIDATGWLSGDWNSHATTAAAAAATAAPIALAATSAQAVPLPLSPPTFAADRQLRCTLKFVCSLVLCLCRLLSCSLSPPSISLFLWCARSLCTAVLRCSLSLVLFDTCGSVEAN